LIQLSIDEVEEKIKLAYTISCHGSQGCEYPYIILPFINQHGKMLLQRNLLYTAITRAREKVIVIGHGSAIERAINNASVSKRNTKLGERITRCLQLKKKNSLSEQPRESVDSPDVHPSRELSSLEEAEFYPMDITEK
jgi:exodeoxyribonuclease V alpha subunit